MNTTNSMNTSTTVSIDEKKKLENFLSGAKDYIEKKFFPIEQKVIMENQSELEEKLKECFYKKSFFVLRKGKVLLNEPIENYIFIGPDILALANNHEKINDGMILGIFFMIVRNCYPIELPDAFIEKFFYVYFSRPRSEIHNLWYIYSKIPLFIDNIYFTRFHKILLSKTIKNDFEKRLLNFIENDLMIKYFSDYESIKNNVIETKKSFIEITRSISYIYLKMHDRYDFSNLTEKEKFSLSHVLISNMSFFEIKSDGKKVIFSNGMVNYISKLFEKVNINALILKGRKKGKKNIFNILTTKKNFNLKNTLDRIMTYFLIEFGIHDYSEEEVKKIILAGLGYGSEPFLHLVKSLTADEFMEICFNTSIDKKSLIKYFQIDFSIFEKSKSMFFFTEFFYHFRDDEIALKYILKKCRELNPSLCSEIICDEKEKIEISYNDKKRREKYLMENNYNKYLFYDFNNFSEKYREKIFRYLYYDLNVFIEKNKKHYTDKKTFSKAFFAKHSLKIINKKDLKK